ncbi:hypothetical protein BDY19DRAFT_920796 [Irpex rosettiformis]|uniref:Uncharacterized protein n=1 Tax=Irpex rosettiformis TaxID=378272 RepID=A0ACB8UIA6_9APHY|nr:hypothetical protein BDY19DRAFT_920796 [Irpex rosettiformis]
MDREAAAKLRASSAQGVVNDALQRKLRADLSFKNFEQEERSSRMQKEQLDSELAGEDEIDEETLRQAELAESIRKIRELMEMEMVDKEERARKELQAEEARLRREQEEVERVAQEQREREEQERLEAERRHREEEAKQKLYGQAVAKEQERCRLRDLKFCSPSYATIWHEQSAFERFKTISNEFDDTKYQESQPLTFESVPWPVLAHPHSVTFDTIDWSAVEEFFNAIEKLLKDKGQYKTLVEKAHRRFHPDKWRARGMLSSVLDQDLRGQLEVAGNVVAQAITPLWLKSRQ